MLRLGKVRENVLKRSVLKEIHYKNKDVLQGAALGEDSAIFSARRDSIAVSTGPTLIDAKANAYLSVVNIVNNIAAQGADPAGVLVSILLPEGSDEAELKRIMRSVDEACRELGVQAAGGHTEVTTAVNRPVITVTGIGYIAKDNIKNTAGALPGDDIIVTKWIALEGTGIIATEKKSELRRQFHPQFVENACDFVKYTSIAEEAEIVRDLNISAMHDMASGGVFAALWEMACSSGVGLDVDLMKIPVRQETIEITEVYGINPYELHSGGSLVIAASDGEAVVRALEQKGFPATIIGKITEGADRIVRNDDETRYLELPKADEIIKMF